MNRSDPIWETPKLTPQELKNINRWKIYDHLYQAKKTSKQEIAQALGLSIPTVTQSLNVFIERGFVKNYGEAESTGGRRAQIFGFHAMARVAVGVEVLKEGVQIVAVDLYGTILSEDYWQIPFENQDGYYRELCRRIDRFSEQLHCTEEQDLGVCITIQGLVSSDGETITFSEILNSTGVSRRMYQQYLTMPCKLMHDTEAAALAEVWHRPDIGNAVYLALNRNFGGILIVNGRVFNGGELSSGIIEHMCIDPDGPLCYCGKQGCVETFCSANSLRSAAQMDLGTFFERMHGGDPRCCKIWRNYLHKLALTIDNIRMIIDCEFILSGYLLEYMNEDDIQRLTRYVKEQCAFDSPDFSLRLGRYGSKSASLGAAISLIEDFLDHINW